MNKGEPLWQAIKTYWQYRYVDPVLKTGYLLVAGGLGMISVVSGGLYLILQLRSVPASLEIGQQSSFWLGIILCAAGVALVVWRSGKLSEMKTGVLILHRCMAGMQSSDPTVALPTKMKMGVLDTINEDDQAFQRNGATIDPVGLLQKASNLDEQLRTRIGDSNKISVAYAGLAPVPLLVIAGYKLTNRQNILVMDYDRDSGWHLLDALDDGASLNISEPNASPTTDVAVSVSVSAPISRNDIPEKLRDVCFDVVIEGGAHRDSASSAEKQKRLCRQLYNLLTSIRAEYPGLDVVHVFLAAQASLAFRFGQTVTQSVHPPVQVYQFEKGRYTWSVRIQSGFDPKFVADYGKPTS